MEIKGRNIASFLKTPPAKLRLALLYGRDAGMVRERANQLARTVLDDLTDPFRVTEMTGAEMKSDPARLADEAAAIAMLGGRRLVRVRDADHAGAKVIEGFLDDLPGDALVIVEAGDIGKGALTRAVEGAGDEAVAVACYPDEGEDLRSFIVGTLKAEGLGVDADALADLMSRLGDDRRMTRGELLKLAMYKGPDGKRSGSVSREDVELLLGIEQEADLSEIADACAGGDMAALDSAYARAIAGGDTAQGVLRMVLMHMERVQLGAGLIAEGMEPDRVIDKAFPRLMWKRKGAVQRHLRAWTPESAMRAVTELSEAEIMTRRTELPADAVAGRALLLIAAAARRAGQGRA